MLESADKMSADDICELQLRMLKSILNYAYLHTAYYKNTFDKIGFDPEAINSIEDINVIPVLTKQIFDKNILELCSDESENFYSVTTGGTTGKPKDIHIEKNAIFREWAFVYHYWSKFGYDYKRSRLATFRGVDLAGKQSVINPLYNEIRMNLFVMNIENIRHYVSSMDNYNVDFIYGYPSAIYNFCRLCKKAGIEVKGKYKAAFLVSENVYPFQEKMIKQVLECDIAVFYGHSERAVFAERFDSGYVFNPLYGVFDVNDKGNAIVTGFINRKMPLIRYELDDYLEKKDDGTYEVIGHRESEVLLGGKGEQISMAAINFHDDTFEDIEAYQFFQEEPGECVVRIVSDKNVDLDKIFSRVQQKLGRSIQCSIEKVSSVQLTKRGKYKMLIQDFTKKEND